MEILQEHAVLKNKKYYLYLENNKVKVNKTAFHKLKGRYYKKNNYWVFPENCLSSNDTPPVEEVDDTKSQNSVLSQQESIHSIESNKSSNSVLSQQESIHSIESNKSSNSVLSQQESIKEKIKKQLNLIPVKNISKKKDKIISYNYSYNINPPSIFLDNISQYLI